MGKTPGRCTYRKWQSRSAFVLSLSAFTLSSFYIFTDFSLFHLLCCFVFVTSMDCHRVLPPRQKQYLVLLFCVAITGLKSWGASYFSYKERRRNGKNEVRSWRPTQTEQMITIFPRSLLPLGHLLRRHVVSTTAHTDVFFLGVHP